MVTELDEEITEQDERDAEDAHAAYLDERHTEIVKSKLLSEGWLPPSGVLVAQALARLDAQVKFAGPIPF